MNNKSAKNCIDCLVVKIDKARKTATYGYVRCVLGWDRVEIELEATGQRISAPMNEWTSPFRPTTAALLRKWGK